MDNGRESINNKYELLRLYSVLEKIENEFSLRDFSFGA